jgi:chloramphenicol-sensitive protein RarD
LGNQDRSIDSRVGIVAGMAAYGLWGLMPLYFAALRNVPSYEILAQRIVWCGVFLAGIVTIAGRWPDVSRAVRTPRVIGVFLVTSVLLSINWLVYIHGVTSGQTIETSLGYFINPLLNVALGMMFFRERLRSTQIAAVALAAVGVVNLIVVAGHFPWIALSIALSFAFYGLIRKTAPADALLGLTLESFILLAPAIAFATYLLANGELHLGPGDWRTNGLLLASGVITAVPLLCFGVAAQHLRLSTLGFLQYLAPTGQFLLAVIVLGEEMTRERWISFGCIWTALAVYSFDTWRGLRPARRRTEDEARTVARELEVTDEHGSESRMSHF